MMYTLIIYKKKNDKLLKKMEFYLKRNGLILIREPEISFFLKFFLYILNDEAWSFKVDIFNSKKKIFNPRSPWDANNATATLLFKNEDKFNSHFPQYKIIKNELSEFLIFLNSVLSAVTLTGLLL